MMGGVSLEQTMDLGTDTHQSCFQSLLSKLLSNVTLLELLSRNAHFPRLPKEAFKFKDTQRTYPFWVSDFSKKANAMGSQRLSQQTSAFK